MYRRCGCDYVNNIRGVGPVKALTLIQKHGDIEGVLENLDLTKYPLPEPFPFKVGGQPILICHFSPPSLGAISGMVHMQGQHTGARVAC